MLVSVMARVELGCHRDVTLERNDSIGSHETHEFSSSMHQYVDIAPIEYKKV